MQRRDGPRRLRDRDDGDDVWAVFVNLLTAFTYSSCFLVWRKVVWRRIVRPWFRTSISLYWLRYLVELFFYAYCIVYVAVFSALAITMYFQWGRTTPAIAPFPGGSGPHLICGSLGQPESTTQMDQFIRFCRAHSWVQQTDRQV